MHSIGKYETTVANKGKVDPIEPLNARSTKAFGLLRDLFENALSRIDSDYLSLSLFLFLK